MSSENTTKIVLEYFTALSGKEKSEALVNSYVDDWGLREHILRSEAAFPRYRMDLEDVVVDGDRAAVRFTVRVRHEGDFMGMPPSGREAAIPAIGIYTIRGGRIVDHSLVFDSAGLLQQLAPQEMPAQTV